MDGQIGHLRVIDTIGIGSIATVYRVQDLHAERLVALKQLLPHLAADPEIRFRFLANASTLARLSHPSLVKVHEIGEDEAQLYFTMELIEAGRLSSVLTSGTGLAPQHALDILWPLAHATGYLHESGFVHRGIHPDNVMLVPTRRIVLMDFGAGHLLESTRREGSGLSAARVEGVSQEEVKGLQIGPPADIYALGVLTYWLLAGNPPFTGDAAHVLHSHAFELPPPLERACPGLTRPIYRAVAAALAKEPADRPADAMSFANLLFGVEQPLSHSRRLTRRQVIGFLATVPVLVGTGIAASAWNAPKRDTFVVATPSPPNLPDGLHVVADDTGAASYVASTETLLAAILPRLKTDFAVEPNGPLTIHLATTEAAARARLASDPSFRPADVDAFFQSLRSEHPLSTSGTSVVDAILEYLPYVSNRETDLAYGLTDQTLAASGGYWYRDVYPYWFLRGYTAYVGSALSGDRAYSDAYWRSRATEDLNGGTRPALRSISTQADAAAFAADHTSGVGAIDARGMALLGLISNRYGRDAVVRLLKENHSGTISNFNSVLKTITGMDPDELDIALDAYLRQQ